MKRYLVIALAALSAVSLSQMAAEPNPFRALHLKDLMTSADFRATGLQKLTPDELKKLDEWVADHTFDVAKAALSIKGNTATTQVAPTPAAVESEIDGEFHGWDGETIFKLTDGEIWQQSEYDYTYEYAYRPSVTIYKTASCWKMKVEDVDDAVCVKRIK